jgi:hypothetical protein
VEGSRWRRKKYEAGKTCKRINKKEQEDSGARGERRGEWVR